MRHKILALCAAAAVVLVLVVGSGRYLARHTTKIDDTVSLVTLVEHVIVMERGAVPRVVRVRPAVVPPKVVNVAQPKAPDPKQPAAKQATPPATVKWTLPYSCSDVRYYNSHFTPAQLDAMRKAAGMAMPSADQRAQIQACLAGRVK